MAAQTHGLERHDEAVLIDPDKHRRLCTRHGALREEIAELNRKLNNDSELRRQLQRGGTWERWKSETTAYRDQLVNEHNAISALLSADMKARRAAKASRRDAYTSNDLSRFALAAKEIIEALHDQIGDDQPLEHRQVCAGLRELAKAVPYLTRPEVLEQMRKQHESELLAMRQQSDRSIAALRHQVQDLQTQRGTARRVLDRLYQGRYEEVDTFRKDRGITHRIHLSDRDCQEIEDAIAGYDKETT